MDFRWNEWNIEHLAGHGVSPESAERVIEEHGVLIPEESVTTSCSPGDVRSGELLQVIFVLALHCTHPLGRERMVHGAP